jgi:hypothetical protein
MTDEHATRKQTLLKIKVNLITLYKPNEIGMNIPHVLQSTDISLYLAFTNELNVAKKEKKY